MDVKISSFTGKVILITGACSSIGAACAIHFSKSYAMLSIVGRNEENLKHVAEECRLQSGLSPLVIVADMTADQEVEGIVKTTAEHYGKIDVLVNNTEDTVPSCITGSSYLIDCGSMWSEACEVV